jgi:uncharacterized SAM-binding protein YcdF (DUF218 family)
VRRWLALALVLIGLGYLGSFAWVWWVSRQDNRQPVDAIVVMGAAHYNGKPSPVLKARVDHGLELFRARLSRTIVVTGGTHPGDAESEAQVQGRYLTAAGVAPEAIVPIAVGQSTEESITALAIWAESHGVRSVLLVSDGFHLARLRLEAGKLGLKAYTTPAPTSPIVPGSATELGYFLREAAKLPIALFH